MKQANLIKISKFQIDNDGDLLLISEADKLPFLEVNEKGVAFDAGPFTGAFCDLNGLSKFIVKGKRKAACILQLKFAEADIYPIGRFHFSETQYEQYNEALLWVIDANKRIAERKGETEVYSMSITKAVRSVIAKCIGQNEKYLKLNTSIKKITVSLDSLERQNLIHEVEKRFQIFLPDSIFVQDTIADVIDYVNAQVEDETDLHQKLSPQPER
ncbi:hypothetical protein F4X73_04530 [Candidatus Poribacteria bacterium]|nr:hypothetical protein [Candidatus Poribacteria bacterium]